MKVLMVEPGKSPYAAEIESGLKSLQAAVGYKPEMFAMFSAFCIKLIRRIIFHFFIFFLLWKSLDHPHNHCCLHILRIRDIIPKRNHESTFHKTTGKRYNSYASSSEFRYCVETRFDHPVIITFLYRGKEHIFLLPFLAVIFSTNSPPD